VVGSAYRDGTKEKGQVMKMQDTIQAVRLLEDAIRETKQYTEGLFTERRTHPVQGEECARAFTKVYELYIDAPLHSMNDDISAAFDWFDSRVAVFRFWYDYRGEKASIEVSERGLALAIEKFECIATAFEKHKISMPTAQVASQDSHNRNAVQRKTLSG